MLQVWIAKTFPQFQLDVRFQVTEQLVALFGPSGSGKSSTLAAVAGLIQPERGQIIVDGAVFLDTQRRINLSPQQRQIGYVFQSYALFPHRNVAENIGFGLHRWSRHRRQERIQELLALFELEDLAQQPIQKISGGQAQRVALARAIAAYPRLLLLDEPFTALDDPLRESLRSQLKLLQRQLGLPVLLVTHSRGEAMEFADQVVILEAGRVVDVGQPNQLLNQQARRTLQRNFQWG